MAGKLKVYDYDKCSTCRNALKFLEKQGVLFDRVPIVERPPTKAELAKMLAYLKADGLTFKQLFNTSGQVYRELEIGEKIKAGMSESAALDLLANNGKLIKRPFALGDGAGTVGFNESTWKKIFV